MVAYDYFSAASDEDAAAAVDDTDCGAYGLSGLKGADPTIALWEAESLLTGRPYEVISEGERAGHAVAVVDDGAIVVLTITDEMRDELATVTHAELAAVAVLWSESDEFGGRIDPDLLVDFLERLSDLANAACEVGHRLYCRCVV